MASIQTRTGPRGTTYAVLYRLHGKQTSTTRDTLKDAKAVKALIDAKGAETALRLLAAEETGGGITVGELAEKWLESPRRLPVGADRRGRGRHPQRACRPPLAQSRAVTGGV